LKKKSHKIKKLFLILGLLLSLGLLLGSLLGFGEKDSLYPLSSHYDGKVFYNPPNENEAEKSLWDVLKWQWERHKTPWPEEVINTYKPLLPKEVKKNTVAITFINHSTFLIQEEKLNFITDPIFSKRASPVSFIGPKRVREPGVSLSSLPPIDVVLISHNHYDHMDLPSLMEIEKASKPLFIVPLGNKKYLKDIDSKRVIELDWWQTYEVSSSCSITLTPAHHWSSRSLLDRREALWGSFVINLPNRRVFFAGDTAYETHFKEIQKKFDFFHVALLPIGAYEPRWFMRGNHMNPEEAVLTHIDLKSQKSIGMHFGTFQLTDEGIDTPIEDLKVAREKYHIPKKEFHVLEFGETSLF
jgi:L-ascorbate metabolism protein UlaG (beta-lactamase superfamily)